MKILLQENPFSDILSKLYFNDGRTRYYTEKDENTVQVEYVCFNDLKEGEAVPLLYSPLLVCGEFQKNHYDKRLNQPNFCMEIVLEGAMYVRCNSVIYLAEAGDIAVMPPHQEYEFSPNEGGVRKIGLLLDGRLLDTILVGCGIDHATVFTPESPLQEMFDAIEELRRCIDAKKQKSGIGGAAFRILSVLENMVKKEGREGPVDQLRLYIDGHMHIRTVLQDCCKTFGLSPYQLRQIFVNALHTTPKDYLASLRMTRAAEMLMNDLPIKEVAQQCGYNSSLNFSTAFRHWYKLPPGKYRKQRA